MQFQVIPQQIPQPIPESIPNKTPVFISTVLFFIVGAFSFVAALAFNDAFQTLFNKLFIQFSNVTVEIPWSVVITKFIYSFLVLITIILIIFLLSKRYDVAIPGSKK